MASFNFNHVLIGGRLTEDVELKSTNSGDTVTSFSVAVNRRGGKDKEKTADFFQIVAWGKTAEFVSKYFHKGSSIFVVGHLNTRTYTDQNNIKKYITEVIADEINFVDSKSENESGGYSGNRSEPANIHGVYETAGTVTPAPALEELGSDEELPF